MMTEAEFDQLVTAVEQQVIQSAAFYGLYWAQVGKPKFDEMVDCFEEQPSAWQAIELSAELSLVVSIRKFWDSSPQALSYHQLLHEAQLRNPDFSKSSLAKIEAIRQKVTPWREDIRTLRDKIYAHSDRDEARAEITINHTKELIIEMGEIFSIIMIELGGNSISPETVIDQTYKEALSLWSHDSVRPC